MTSLLVAALIAVAAIGATYLLCVRPMLHRGGHCAMMSSGAGPDAEFDRELAELREELRILRAEESLDSGRVSGSTPRPLT